MHSPGQGNGFVNTLTVATPEGYEPDEKITALALQDGEKAGIDPVHFGVVIVLNLMIGLITPPVCFLSYLTTTIAQASFEKVVRESWPFILALILALLTSTFFPGIVLWLPNLLMGGK